MYTNGVRWFGRASGVSPLAICPSSRFSGFGLFRLSTVRPFGFPTTITLMEWLDREYQDPRNEEISEFYPRDRDSSQRSALARRSCGAIGDVEESS